MELILVSVSTQQKLKDAEKKIYSNALRKTFF